MKVVVALTMAVALGWFAGEARAQQKQSDKETLEQLKEKLEGAEIRLQIAKVKARIAEADVKATKEILRTTEERITLYERVGGTTKSPVISWEEMANLRLTRDKYYQESIQKQGATELSQLDVRYREWQYRRVEAAIKRLKAAKEK